MLLLIPLIAGASVLGAQELWRRVRRNRAQKPKPKRSQVARPRPAPESERILVARTTRALQWLGPKTDEEAEMVMELGATGAGLGLAVAGVTMFTFPAALLLQIAGAVCLAPTMLRISGAAYRHLRREKRVSADVLSTVLLAGSLAGGYFVALLVGGEFFVLVRWLALKTENHSKEGIVELFGQHARSAWLLVDGAELEVPLENVRAGDVIVVQAGHTIPTDGVILEGSATVDQHMLTGEAQPVEKGPGDPVSAATIVHAGRLSILVEKAGDDTTAAQIARMLTDTADYRDSLVSDADRFNDRMALPFLVLGGVTFPLLGLGSALAVLQAVPGYRMVLFGPLSMLSFLHLAAENGVLIKDGRSLEILRDVDTVVFDKTGTLTMDQPRLHRVLTCSGFSNQSVLTAAAAVEARQNHPIARAILEAAESFGIVAPPVEEADYEIGYGISARVNGNAVRVGSARFMNLHGIQIPEEIQAAELGAYKHGYSFVLVAVDGKIAGAIVLEPAIRPEVPAIVTQLRSRGLKMFLMSGDREAPASHLASKLRLDGCFAEVLPDGKADLVRRLQSEGRKVCFVGDGINDSIALKSADVSISLSGASTIAVDTAQIVMMEGNLVQLSRAFELAGEFAENMRINRWAAMLPSVAILGGVFFFGMSYLSAMIVYQVSVPFALFNTVRPLIEKKRSSADPAHPSDRPLALLTAGEVAG